MHLYIVFKTGIPRRFFSEVQTRPEATADVINAWGQDIITDCTMRR